MPATVSTNTAAKVAYGLMKLYSDAYPDKNSDELAMKFVVALVQNTDEGKEGEDIRAIIDSALGLAKAEWEEVPEYIRRQFDSKHFD